MRRNLLAVGAAVVGLIAVIAAALSLAGGTGSTEVVAGGFRHLALPAVGHGAPPSHGTNGGKRAAAPSSTADLAGVG